MQMTFKNRYAHGMDDISENTAYRSLLGIGGQSQGNGIKNVTHYVIYYF